MSGQAQLSILALHVVGVIVWVGGMMGLTSVLAACARAGDGEGELPGLARRTALVMDIGALLAIAGGAGYLAVTRDLGEAWALKNGWFHAKLGLVVLLLAAHGLLRARAGRAARGEPKAPPRMLHSVLGLLVLAIVALAVVRPF